MKRFLFNSFIVAGLAGGLVTTSACVEPPAKSEGGGEGADGDAPAGTGAFVTMDQVDDGLKDKVTGDRYQITYQEGDMWHGAESGALVTIVEYSDFQCPYCSRLTDALRELAEKHPEDVRIVFKHYPLAMHRDARPASEAVLAAHAQGKEFGWAMHDIVFKNARKLSKDDLIAYAEQAKVPDMDKFKADLEGKTFGGAVEADMTQGKRFGVTSTPSFFINGRPQRGAKNLEALEKLVEEEKAFAQTLLDAGATRDNLYAHIMRHAKTKREAPKRPNKKKQGKQAGKPDPAANYAVPVTDRPMKGKAEALVTIVEYSDFECPYCRKVLPTLTQIEEEYGDDVRVVFRQQPLPMHKNAKPAALAALAAHKQDKFWEMHDALFEKAGSERGALGKEGVYSELATQLGLDVAKFEADMKDPELAKMIAEDQKVAQQFGAGGTPAFFVNGRFVSGAQPFEAFKAIIDQEKAKAEKFMADKGVKPEDLYEEMLKGWETEVKAPPIADHQRRQFDLSAVPGKGNTTDPKLTIVECSDFDCPYCTRGAKLIEDIFAAPEYKDKVAFYFLNFPLPMHKNAESAHRAAVAAGKQGKFFEMHDVLFANKGKRTEQDYRDFAAQIGIDVDKFIADWNSEETAQKVQDDKAVCAKNGVSGTPNFFINGRSMRGAVPFEMAKAVLDEELAGGFEAKKKGAPAKKDEAKKPEPKKEDDAK
ncbi:DSBA-like thioredoxin domain protein [Plesiocystis pacifica SIR-1]|uniref:DSBA-like thioredoxin domain protein n=1 Tax=Plesiocystis pacifica SIR-1 TaxID=391625 RepID=A6GEL1_9BACT|nr:thioredoxin domain-containing protein [Plesiocystis pacifica]EDM75719.1 DSBA-like thioredoxin domain protein [Plesiocystis pacifica SIR-1]